MRDTLRTLVCPLEALALPEHVRCLLLIPLPNRPGLTPAAGDYLLDPRCEIML